MRAGSVAAAVASAAVIGALVAGCGGSSAPSRTEYLASGQVPAADLPHGGARTASAFATTTVPLASENPLTALFQSMSVFQSCLQGMGVTFIGVPNQNDPNSPANDPNYIKSLQTCAAQSGIVQALKELANSENNLTPAQIKTQNKEFLQWRTCMIGRGWQIPEPTPDSDGRLFTAGASVSGWVPPPGQSILDSGDMEACANQVAQQDHVTGTGT